MISFHYFYYIFAVSQTIMNSNAICLYRPI